MSNPSLRQLTAAFEKAEHVIPFDPAWKNGTGYLDHAVTADLGLTAGKMVWFTDDKGRTGVIIGSPLGNIVVFERYTPKVGLEPNDPVVVVTNVPRELKWLYNTSLTADELNTIVGVGNPNLGERLDSMKQAMLAQ